MGNGGVWEMSALCLSDAMRILMVWIDYVMMMMMVMIREAYNIAIFNIAEKEG